MLRNPRFNANAGRVIPNASDPHAAAPVTQETAPSTSASASAPTTPATPLEAGAVPKSAAQPPRKNASVRHGLRRDSTFRSISSLLVMSNPQNSINVLRTSLNEIHERVRYRWVLHPLSPWKAIWDVVSALVVIYYSWMVPFMLCFDWYVIPKQTKVFLRILDVWGCLDIILRLRTGIVEYGAVVMNPKIIRKHYLHSIWFPIDVASTVPFELFLSDPANASTRKTIKMIKYVKLPRLLRIGRFLKVMKGYKRYSSLTIAINALLFLSHVAGCIWVAIVQPCDGVDVEVEPRCKNGEEMSIYWIAFHHGIVSLLGISSLHVESSDQILSGGYNHPPGSALSSNLYLWSSIVSIFGAILTAVVFGTVISLVQSWNRVEYAFRKKMDQISHEMDALALPGHIRARVTAYYDYLWLNSRTFSEELNLLKDNGMSLALRQQIAIYLFKDYLQKIPFFQLATDAVLGMICMQLHQVIYMPDDYIIQEGDIGKELFMIVKGIVRVMPPKSNPTTTEDEKKILLGEGDFFGEIGVVMEVERTRSVKAECMAELCILSREGFDKILVEFPEFAMAMKRLIIKRVGEMWSNNDGKEKIEKMTRLADYKMKKKIATYNHVKKLRGTAHVIHSFAPRLSNLVKEPVPADVLGIDETELAEIREISAHGVTAGAHDGLEPIDEHEHEHEIESHNEFRSRTNGARRPTGNYQIKLLVDPSGNHHRAPVQEDDEQQHQDAPEHSSHSLIELSGHDNEHSTHGLIEVTQVEAGKTASRRVKIGEKHLATLEQKLADRMHALDAKLNRILDCLGGSENALTTTRPNGG